MRPDMYLILNGSELNLPQHPGYLPVILYGATEATRSELLRQHKVIKTTFYITKTYYDALKQQILSSLQNDYVERVSNANVGFVQTTALELLNHLYNSYGTITSS